MGREDSGSLFLLFVPHRVLADSVSEFVIQFLSTVKFTLKSHSLYYTFRNFALLCPRLG